MVRPAGICTCTGTDELVVVLFPNCPLLLFPQAQAVPSDASAREWKPLVAIWVMVRPVGICTCTGTDELVVVLFPKLPVEVASPGPDGAIRRKRQRVERAAAIWVMVRPAGTCTCTGTDDRCGVVSQLAVGVESPGPDGAIGRKRQRMGPATGRSG